MKSRLLEKMWIHPDEETKKDKKEFNECKRFIETENNMAYDFLQNIKKDVKLICWGGGYALYWYNKFFELHGIKPDYILDKNGKLGTEMYGIPIVTPEYVLDKEELSICKFVVTAPKYREEIIKEIQDIFGEVQIYSFEAEIYCAYIQDINSYRTYLLEHWEDFTFLYESLEDSKSRETMIAFFKGRISGNQKFFIDVMEPDQYFPKDVIVLGSDETIVEVGANDGRTLQDIIKRVDGKYNKIFCFEPDKECISILENIIKEEKGNVELIKKGVGKEKTELKFKTDSKWGASKVVKGDDFDYCIEITNLDSEIKTEVTYIKMDIEGMELNALKGAEHLIKSYKPKLAICVYHEKEDFLEIYSYLKKLEMGYRFYLRHHNWGATETVLYAL